MANMVDSMGEQSAFSRGTSRRTFLMEMGAATLIVVRAPALASAATTGRVSSPLSRAAFPPAGLKGDLMVVAVAASLENLAVFSFSAGPAAAKASKLGAVPPAVATFATTVLRQHTDHALAWNSVLKTNNKAPVTVVKPLLAPVVKADFAKVTNITGLALTCETDAAET